MLSNISNQIDPEGEWQHLQSVGRKDLMRTVNGKTKIETRYFTLQPTKQCETTCRFSPSALGNREFFALGTRCSFSGR